MFELSRGHGLELLLGFLSHCRDQNFRESPPVPEAEFDREESQVEDGDVEPSKQSEVLRASILYRRVFVDPSSYSETCEEEGSTTQPPVDLRDFPTFFVRRPVRLLAVVSGKNSGHSVNG